MRNRIIATLSVTLCCACASSNQETKSSQPTVESQPAPDQPTVTPEQNDAIDAVFRRKAPQLQSCWAEEFDRSHNKKLEGDISLQMMVSKTGHARDVKIVKSTMGVDAVDQCVIKEITGWAFPEGPADAPFRRTVHLGPEF